jgi:hypothetical protein
MSDSKKDYMMKGQFTAENSVLVLVDYQLGTMQTDSDLELRRLSAQRCDAGHRRQDLEHAGRPHI